MLLTISLRADSFIQLLTVLLIFLFVLAISYLTVRFVGKWQKGQESGSNIEILETRSIGTNKYLCIVRVGEKYLLIASGKDEVSMLTELDKDSLSFEEKPTDGSFSTILDRVRKLKK